MISTAEFYGGAKDIGTASSTYSITDTSIRVHRASWTSGTPTINLPGTGFIGVVAPSPEGGPLFYIVNDGSVSISIAYTFNGSAQATTLLGTNRTALVLGDDRSFGYTIVILTNA